jgi:hypothetical protein
LVPGNACGRAISSLGIEPESLRPSSGGSCRITMITPMPDMKPEITVYGMKVRV